MSRQYNIRWRKQDYAKLTRTVRLFNSKLTRTVKKHPEFKSFLPDRISTGDIKANIKTRADFNREMNKYNRFLQKGAEQPYVSEKGIKTTKWEKREVGYKVAQINRQRRRERNRPEINRYNGTLGTIENNNLQPKQYNIDSIEPGRWKNFVAQVEKQVMSNYNNEKMEQYKENYLKAIDEVFHGQLKTDLQRIASKIPANELVELFYSDPNMQIGFIYDPKEEEYLYDIIVETLAGLGY